MKQKLITKDYLLDKAMEIDNIWHTLEIIDKGVTPNSEMVSERSMLVGKLRLINELIDYLDETT